MDTTKLIRFRYDEPLADDLVCPVVGREAPGGLAFRVDYLVSVPGLFYVEADSCGYGIAEEDLTASIWLEDDLNMEIPPEIRSESGWYDLAESPEESAVIFAYFGRELMAEDKISDLYRFTEVLEYLHGLGHEDLATFLWEERWYEWMEDSAQSAYDLLMDEIEDYLEGRDFDVA